METGTTESTVAKLHIFSIFRYMPKAGRALYEMHGRDASRICKMSCAELAGHGLTDSVIKKIKDPRLMDMQYENLKWYESEGISIIDYNSGRYPPLLKETGDLPPMLFLNWCFCFICFCCWLWFMKGWRTVWRAFCIFVFRCPYGTVRWCRC